MVRSALIRRLSLLTALIVVSGAGSAEPTQKIIERQGVRFALSYSDAGSINTLHLDISIGSQPLASIDSEIDGTVTDVVSADLDGNGYPEIYLFVTSAGSGSYGSIVGWSSNRNRSFTPIAVAPLDSNVELAGGYMGHDRYSIEGGTLIRRFPIYNPGDTNASPSGGVRELHYQLVAGEAGWELRPATRR